jgi:ABC-2 type transport system permease protein
MLTDILSGYFDKLLLAPINRFSILLATLFTASLRAIIQVVIIMAIALGMGVSFKTGALGMLVVIWFAVTFSVGWTCLGIIIALRTRSPEVTQSYFVVFFPAVFLTTAFVPAEFLPGWFRVLTQINPVTYILNSARVLVIGGWDWGGLWQGLVVVVSFAGMLIALTTWFFRRATA